MREGRIIEWEEVCDKDRLTERKSREIEKVEISERERKRNRGGVRGLSMLIVLSVGRRGPEQDVDPLPTDMSCLDSRYSHLTSDTCSPLASLRSEGRQHDDITRLR